ncbi:MAG: signal peptidase I [Candidatus Hydrogenedentes bacterium]|nr:signal peptidase I [Candidatus Hydrogenedentota bacterium]
MAIDREEIDKLHEEAKRVRKNFRYIIQDLKRSPENIDLLRQREHLKKRYDQIQTMLTDAREARDALLDDEPEGQEVPQIDMSIFEPKPYEVPVAVVVQQRTASARTGGSPLTFKNVRIAITAALLLVLVPFFYLYFMRNMRFYEVPTRSMEPTLQAGDRIIAVEPSQYARGDIVVLNDPQAPGDYLVKRLVAFAGDSIEVVNGALLINNQPIDEPYIRERMEYIFGPVTVSNEEVYLLGDNRNESDDSHIWQSGRPLSELRGRVHFIYSPSSRRSSLDNQRARFHDVKSPD